MGIKKKLSKSISVSFECKIYPHWRDMTGRELYSMSEEEFNDAVDAFKKFHNFNSSSAFRSWMEYSWHLEKLRFEKYRNAQESPHVQSLDVRDFEPF